MKRFILAIFDIVFWVLTLLCGVSLIIHIVRKSMFNIMTPVLELSFGLLFLITMVFEVCNDYFVISFVSRKKIDAGKDSKFVLAFFYCLFIQILAGYIGSFVKLGNGIDKKDVALIIMDVATKLLGVMVFYGMYIFPKKHKDEYIFENRSILKLSNIVSFSYFAASILLFFYAYQWEKKYLLILSLVLVFFTCVAFYACFSKLRLLKRKKPEKEKRSMPELVVINILTFLFFALCVIGVFYFGQYLLIKETIASASIGVFAFLFFYKFWNELMIRMGKKTEEDMAEKAEREERFLRYLFFPSSINAKVRLTAKIARCIFLALFILVFLILFIWLHVITFVSIGIIIAFVIWLINEIKEAIEIHAEIEYYKKKEAEEAKKAEEDDIWN